MASFEPPPDEIVLDVDATDAPLYGHQEGRWFHGDYGHYCYLPLSIFCGEQVLCARLRASHQDGAAGTEDELARIVPRIRAAWPEGNIRLRGDSRFCREGLLSGCEANRVDYGVGLAKTERWKDSRAAEMAPAKPRDETTGQAARGFKGFRDQTLKSWSCARRVVGKAEYMAPGETPRFMVSSISVAGQDARQRYEDCDCARGDMENRIKEQQLALFADGTPTHDIRTNHLRLMCASCGYVLVQALRRLGLEGSTLAKAQCGTIRLKLFKVGAQIRIPLRKVWIAFSESYPYADIFRHILIKLQCIPLRC